MSTPAVLQFLAVVLVKVSLVLGLASLVDVALLRRRASAATRHFLWSLAVVASLLVPVLAELAPTLRVPLATIAVPSPGSTTVPSAPVRTAPNVTTVAPTLRDDAPTAPSTITPSATREPRQRISFSQIAIVLYLVGAVFVLVRIAVDHAIVRRLSRDATRVTDMSWTSLVESAARRAGIRRPVLVFRSATSVMPLTSGIFRPRIVIPAVADSWEPTMREAVVLHEVAHIARGDYLTQLLAALACALYWVTPLSWWAAARLRVERELACDDHVLSRGVRAHDYASHLLEAARALTTPRFAVSMAASSGLERRLRAVIDETRARGIPSRRAATIAAASMLGMVGSLAAVRPYRAEVTPPPTIAPVVATAQQRPLGGSFAVRLTTTDDGAVNAGRIHVMLHTPGMNTFYEDASHFTGLARGDFARPGTTLRFELRRDAGAIVFTGTMRNGFGDGRFTFVPDTTFADSLARRGIGRPTLEQQFSLARHGVELSFVDDLVRQGYAVPTVSQLVNAGTSGADADYVREMAALGYRERTVSAIIGLSNQGVDPAFVKEANARAGRSLTARELVAARAGRLAFTRPSSPAASPLPSPSPSPARAPATPVAPPAVATEFVDDTVVTGKWSITPRAGGLLQLDIEWANVNQWKRFIRASDLAGISVDDMQRGVPSAEFRIEREAGTFAFDGAFRSGRGAGLFAFQPNTSFVDALKAVGVREVDHVGIHQLKNLAFGFVTSEDARELAAAGPEPLTLQQLVDLSIYSIPPSYPRELRSVGVQGIESYKQLIDLYRAGITADFVRRARSEGQQDLTPDALLDSRRRR